MIAPKCKLCSGRHFGLCQQARRRSETATKREVTQPPKDAPKPETPLVERLVAQHGRWRKYHNKYMTGWRKRQKVKKREADKSRTASAAPPTKET